MRAAALALAVLLSPAAAYANGRMAGAFQIVSKPGNDDVLLTRTTFGLLLSTDRGANWDWLCEGSIGYGADAAQVDPTIAMTGGGSILVGVNGFSNGLSVSTDGGCSFAFAGGALANAPVIDVTVAKSMPSTAVVISSAPIDAGAWSNVLHRSTDDGKNFSPLGVPIDPSVFPITIDVAPSDAQTVYVSARRGFGNVSLFVSTNSAASWTERPIAVTMNEKDAYIAAIDPAKADRVYVRTFDSLSGGGRLLTTDDGGKTWNERYAFMTAPMTGFALSPDGTKVWVGNDPDGLFSADTTIFSFSKVSPVKPKCLGAFGTRLYACTDVKQVFLAVSENAGNDFADLLPYCGLRGPLACAATCGAGWPTLQMGLGYPCPDAGADGSVPSDASAKDSGDGGSVPPPPKSGCSCESGEPSGAAALGLAWAFMLWRRRSGKLHVAARDAKSNGPGRRSG